MTVTLDLRMGAAEFRELCRRHPDLRLERTAEGELVVLMPTGGSTGRRNAVLIQRLLNWAEKDGKGVVFDSSTLFTLPNGAERGPDAAWVLRGRWEGLSLEQQEDFPPLCPDFVIELISRTDSQAQQRAKMGEYVENGVRLGWLIDPYRRRVEIYRPGRAPEILEQPGRLLGEDVLPGLELDLTDIL